MWFVIGVIGLVVASRVNYKVWHLSAIPILMGTLCLLLAVFLPVIGVRVMGASRWINLGFTTIQPSEFAKLAVVIYLSAWFSNKEKDRLMSFIVFLGATVGLVFLQPDMGTGIILMVTSLCLYIVSGAPMKQLVKIIPITLIGVVMLAVVAPYRVARLTTFLNPDSDPLGSSYQIRQATIAIGSGGLGGVGFGKSRQKYEYLPEANTDAIFAVIAEELGFIGSSAVVLVYFLIVWRTLKIVRNVPDRFARLFAIGVTAWFGFQSGINVGAIVSILPLTGVPLPFISYGGSSMVVLFIAFGIVLNISRYTLNKR
jgi:cell division protein FtsW